MTRKRNPLILTLVLALFIAFAATLSACDTNPVADPKVQDPPSHVFLEDYDEVWRAVQLAVRKYPVRLNNIESGILETDYIKGENLFADPIPSRVKQGLRYKITVRAVKGKQDGRSAVKVSVMKTAEIQPDFFTGFVPTPSYGLEEDVILYRIGRFLELDKILAKAGGDSN